MRSLEDEFRGLQANTSCYSMVSVSYKQRCKLSQSLEDCHEIINYFNYLELMYCVFGVGDKKTEIFWMILFIVVSFGYLLLMEIVIDRLFTPILKICAVNLRMNEYLAGLTLLAFANCSPEIVANFLPIRMHSANVTSAFSSALTSLLLSGGLIAFLKPIKIDEFSTVLNLLLLFLAIVSIDLIIFNDYRVGRRESILLLCLYVAYWVLNLADVLFVKYTIKKLRQELGSTTISQHQNGTPRKKLELLNKLRHNDLIIATHRHSKYSGKEHQFIQESQEILNRRNCEMYGTIFHSERNSKNHLLFYDFWQSVSPYDAVEWQLSSWLKRLLIAVEMPLVLIVNLLVPIVDYERYKHGWCKLLNCVQIMASPFILITAVHSKFASVYKSWYIDLNVDYSKWSFCVTVPLALIVFFHTRTDVPPWYHILFISISAPSVIFIIFVCVAEIEILTSTVGAVFDLSEGFVAITFGALSNASIDLIANYSLTMQGYGKMAFAAICAGPFLVVVLALSVSFLTNENVQKANSYFWLYGEHGDNCYIFILLAIVSLLWWCLTLNFYIRRSMGIFLWCLYILFLVYAFGAEWDVWQEFSRDQHFEPR